MADEALPAADRDRTVTTTSGITVEPLYRADPTSPSLADPGEYPFTRGLYPNMYRGRLWTMRQYAGFGTAEETNARFKALLEAGQSGLSVAFDLPTQMGYDSDHPMAEGEVGRVGVAIDSLGDLQRLFDDIPLAEVSTSMTINATAAQLLLLYELAAEAQGADGRVLRGTIQNDVLKEYIARGTYIYPPAASMRLVTDTFAYCAEALPEWNTISISGYHIREAGATAVQELGLTLANGLAYVRAALDAGLDIDRFAPRLSFFWNAHTNLLEEVAKFRAARRVWAELMRERMGARNPKSWAMRFHTQTAGSSLTAQQPLNNVVRTTLEALSAVLGGTQSLHTNGFDEALSLPTDESAVLALRTQQIIAHESGVADTADPLAGSYYVEALTDELADGALALIDDIEERGGAVAALTAGYPQSLIDESAYREAIAVDAGERVVVGVNVHEDADVAAPPVLVVDPQLAMAQMIRLEQWRDQRDEAACEDGLAALAAAARGDGNLLYPLREALRSGATVGETADTFREAFGVYRPGS